MVLLTLAQLPLLSQALRLDPDFTPEECVSLDAIRKNSLSLSSGIGEMHAAPAAVLARTFVETRCPFLDCRSKYRTVLVNSGWGIVLGTGDLQTAYELVLQFHHKARMFASTMEQ